MNGEKKLSGAVRRLIYNRWFYAFLAFVCLVSVTSDVLDLLRPGENPGLDALSAVTSSVAALLAGSVFFDLYFRRGKP